MPASEPATSRTRLRAAALLAGYAFLCALPLMLGMLLAPLPLERRPFLVEFGVALGFLAAGTMAAQFILTARFAAVSRRLGQDTLLRLHKHAGIAAAAFLFAHPVVLIAAEPGFAAFFDPRVNAPRALALTGALAAMTLLMLTSLLRARIAMQYEWWRLLHAFLAAVLMLVTAAHIVLVGHYADPWWKAALLVACAVVPLGLLSHVRLLRPWLVIRRRPWRIAEVRRERERVWTIALEPVGHAGMPFAPGQFVWLTLGDSPLHPRQHPFTIASSAAHPQRLELTIKELGDFTQRTGKIPVGATAWLEGPAGNFTPPGHARGVVFICGGIGITPAISFLRTMRDRAEGPRRPVTLVFANRTLDRAVFVPELDEMKASIGLRLIHIPEEPPDGWSGPSGYVDRAMIAEHLADELATHHFMICGPDPMMDGVEAALLGLGVPRGRIRSERFGMV